MTLPLETINGKQYYVKPASSGQHSCTDCAFLQKNCSSVIQPCTQANREDDMNVVFIEPGGTNEQDT